LEKKELELRLGNKQQELEEAKKRFEREQEDKNKRIHALHAEIKELQNSLAESNSRNAQLDNKNRDLSGQFEKMTNENRETINK
jgi:chromosome segregation ATPase